MSETLDEKDTGRTEWFSDGIFAVAITLLVLDLRPPPGTLPHSILEMWPEFLSFFVSFATILVVWVNHHGLFRLIHKTDPRIMFSNGLFLLFITLVPFPTALLSEHIGADDARWAAAFYSLTWAAIAASGLVFFWTLHRPETRLIRNVQRHDLDRHLLYGWSSIAAYSLAALLSFWHPLAGVALVMLVTAYWAFEAFRQHKRDRRHVAHKPP